MSAIASGVLVGFLEASDAASRRYYMMMDAER